jgi:hypothetical protein
MPSARTIDTGAEVKPVEITDGQGTVIKLATIVKNVAAQAITAGTPVTLHTPTSGKKFRVTGYALSLSVAGSVIFKFGSGNTEFLRTPLLAAGAGIAVPDLDAGVAPGAVNDALKLDATATGSVSGHVLLAEE